ncbi:MAG: Holliday junction branch migration protein RuvA [Spirochaetia bacterium]|jgi:Holliday junction DNA helicase RuvA|nr:Holliday junction branch migration protein RuvA [Spirochaetia bacterium]
MFNSITGTITHKGKSYFFLENNGIEWDIFASAKTIMQLPSPGNSVRVLTYLHLREDHVSIFGFADKKERELFLELIKISGIGPKQAVKIMSGISADDFISALDTENISILSTLPGIGQKTAQKIVLAMRGKLLKEGSDASSPYTDIIKALSDMGFDYRKAAKTVLDISEESDVASINDISEKEKIIMKKAIIALSS